MLLRLKLNINKKIGSEMSTDTWDTIVSTMMYFLFNSVQKKMSDCIELVLVMQMKTLPFQMQMMCHCFDFVDGLYLAVLMCGEKRHLVKVQLLKS